MAVGHLCLLELMQAAACDTTRVAPDESGKAPTILNAAGATSDCGGVLWAPRTNGGAFRAKLP